MRSKLNLIIICLICLLSSCKKDEQTLQVPTYELSQEVIDGITYKCITIGDQVWMAENLRTRIEGGRAQGAMAYNEPFVTFTSKESLELRKIVQSEVNKQWNQGAFNIDSTVNHQSKLMIDELSGNFFNNTTQSWRDHVNWYDYPTDWQATYSRITIDLVVDVVTRLFVEGKEIIILAAADPNYLNNHGYLYTYNVIEKVIPAGWRLPSDEDWMKLEKAMGMSDEDISKIDVWRGDVGKFLKANLITDNFNATMGGAYIYGFNSHNSNNFKNLDKRGYWWTSTQIESDEIDKMYYIRSLRADNDQMLRGTMRINSVHKDVGPPAYSIRLVKNK